jgi:hypothetical protein
MANDDRRRHALWRAAAYRPGLWANLVNDRGRRHVHPRRPSRAHTRVGEGHPIRGQGVKCTVRLSKTPAAWRNWSLIALPYRASQRFNSGRLRPFLFLRPLRQLLLGEEEICDVSLATFYVFDKENPKPGVQLIRGRASAYSLHTTEALCGQRAPTTYLPSVPNSR